jgi:D-alanyl-D-alanine endopeptidase (penicillin-binding protein 7)
MDRGVELDGLSTISKTDSEVARGGARSRLLEGMTVSNRDLLHAALLGSDNRAIPALGRAVKLTPSQLAAAMTAKAKELGLAHTRFHDPTGLSPENVSTPRDTIVMLKTVMKQPVLAGITHRLTYEAHPVGRPPLIYNNTYKPAIRRGIEVLAGKTGYNDEARYCLVIATRMGGQNYFMSFLSNEGKLTRFGDVARVADWILQHKTKNAGEQVASAAPAGTATPAPTAASTATTGISAGTPTPTNAENVAAAPRTLAAKPPGPTVVAPTTPPLPAAAASPTTNPVAPAKAPVTNPPPASASPLIAPAVSPAVPVPTASDAHVPTAAGMATVSPAGSRVVQALAPSSSGSTP